MLRNYLRNSARVLRVGTNTHPHALRETKRALNTNELHEHEALHTKITELNTDVCGLKKEFGDMKQYVHNIRTDIKDLGTRLEISMHEHGSRLEVKLQEHATAQQKAMGFFYSRAFFGVLAFAIVLAGTSIILPMTESTRLDAEIKRRAIVSRGVEEMQKTNDEGDES